MVTVSTLLLSAVGLLLCSRQIGQAQQINRALTLGTELYRGCQGRELALTPCGTFQNRSAVLHIKSVTIFTTSDVNRVHSCGVARECERVIHTANDESLTKDYQHLYLWIASRCEGKSECDATNGTLPEWWKLANVDGDGLCTVLGKTQYFVGVLVDVDCLVTDPIPAVPYPPVTPPKIRPTTVAGTIPTLAPTDNGYSAAGTIPTLAPHPYGGSEGGVTDPPTTPLTQSESTTTEKTITSLSTTQKPTDKPALTTTPILKNGATAPVSGGSGYSAKASEHIGLSVIMGMAVFVCSILMA